MNVAIVLSTEPGLPDLMAIQAAVGQVSAMRMHTVHHANDADLVRELQQLVRSKPALILLDKLPAPGGQLQRYVQAHEQSGASTRLVFLNGPASPTGCHSI